MALERSIMMSDGVIRRHHIITTIQHIHDSTTFIEVVSYPYEQDPIQTGCHTTLQHEFDDTLTFDLAYQWLAEQPEFQEYEMDSDAELIELNQKVDELSSQLETAQTSVTELNSKVTNVLTVLTDDQALGFITYYPVWSADTDYMIDQRVSYDGKLYRCVQAHTSQDNWTPDTVPALWTRIAPPETIIEWVQPTGAQDAYQTGDKVLHNDSVWISTADNNVWEPGVYGWEIFTE